MKFSSCFVVLLLLSSGTFYAEAVDANAVLYLYQVQVNTGTSTINVDASGGAANVSEVYRIMNQLTNPALNVSNPCDGSAWANSTTADTYPCASESTCTVIGPSVFRCKCNSGYNQTASTQSFTLASTTVIPDGTFCPDIDE
uniref:EGF-like domain-containing protein n=1 Tax=Ciona savignyi TaxID=51511 RepID=H2YRL0_CIOSA